MESQLINMSYIPACIMGFFVGLTGKLRGVIIFTICWLTFCGAALLLGI